MFPSTRRCTIVHPAGVASIVVEDALADIAALFANGFTADGLNWTAFPVRGPSRRMGGDRKLLAQVRRRLSGIDGAAGVGVADTAFAALVRALGGDGVIDPGGDRDFLAPFPLVVTAQLGVLSANTAHTFDQLGYRTIGSVAAIDQVLLRDRFGAEGVRLWHLCNGNEISYTEFSEPHEEIVREVSFEEPLNHAEQIVFGVRVAVEEIVALLEKECRLCTQFVLVLETEHSELSERVWQFAHGFSTRSIIERARWQLDEWLLGDQITAGVNLARFTVRATRPSNSEQLTLWGDHSGSDEDTVRLVGKMASLHGSGAVSVAQWRGGRDATRRFALLPAIDLDLVDIETTARLQRPARHEGPWVGVLPSPLPALTLAAPEAVVLCDESGKGVGVTRRSELTGTPHTLTRADGAEFGVLTWAGPWPVEERWWMPEDARRVVQMQIVITAKSHAGREVFDVSEDALLLVMSNGKWHLAACYA
mgnify:CR=1 FL=1